MLILCDVDSTLYDADAHFARVAKALGLGWPTKTLYWFTAEDIGHDLSTVKSMFRKAHSQEWVAQTKPYPGAAETLHQIVEDHPGVEVAYVSDRHLQARGALEYWLSEHGFLARDQYVICTKDKRQWMREAKPDIVIDDRVRTLAMARYEIGATCFAIKHNHNINLVGEIPGVYICDDWYDIADAIQPYLPTKSLVA